MPLDADIAALLDQMAITSAPKLSEGTPAEARANYEAAPRPKPDRVFRVEDRTIPGVDGPVTVRIYWPSDQPGLPLLTFFHGGGWVLSSIEGHDPLARRLAVQTGAIVVSVEYRLAPENPFPAPLDDCWSATRWLSQHGAELGGDPTRLGVAGDSAGGNLAAGVAIRARDEGVALRLQILLYPCVDDAWSTGSMVDNAKGYFLEAKDMEWFWDHYLGAENRSNPYAVPMRSKDLSGVAPALVQTAEFDPLRDQGEAYGQRLKEAGVETTITRYEGVVHGFVARWHTMSGALAAHREIGVVAREAFAMVYSPPTN